MDPLSREERNKAPDLIALGFRPKAAGLFEGLAKKAAAVRGKDDPRTLAPEIARLYSLWLAGGTPEADRAGLGESLEKTFGEHSKERLLYLFPTRGGFSNAVARGYGHHNPEGVPDPGTIEAAAEVFGEESPEFPRSRSGLISGNPDDSRADLLEKKALLKEIVRKRKTLSGDDAFDVFGTETALARLMSFHLKDEAAAVALMEDVCGRKKKILGDSHPELPGVMERLKDHSADEKKLELPEKIAATKKHFNGPTDPGHMRTANELAEFHEKRGDCEKAKAVRASAVDPPEAAAARDSANVAALLRETADPAARHHIAAGETDKAVELGKAFAETRGKSAGQTDPLLERNSLAIVDAPGYSGDYEEAITPCLDYPNSETVLSGRASTSLADGKRKLAGLRLLSGEPEKAPDLYRSVIEAKAEDVSDYMAAEEKINLSEIHSEPGDRENAVKSLQDAPARRIRAGGEDDCQTSAARTKLAETYLKLGDHSASLREAEKAPAANERQAVRIEGKVDPNIGIIAENLMLLGDYERAKVLLEERVMAPLTGYVFSGPRDLETLVAKNRLASRPRLMGDPDGAGAVLDEIIGIATFTLGPDHPETLRFGDNPGPVPEASGDYAGAVAIRESNLEKRIALAGPNHPDTLSNAVNLANALARAERFDESPSPRLDTLPKLAETLGPRHPLTMEAFHGPGTVYRSPGDLDAAIFHAKASAGSLEWKRSTLLPPDPELRRRYLEKTRDRHQLLASLPVGDGRPGEAMEVMRLLKLDELGTSPTGVAAAAAVSAEAAGDPGDGAAAGDEYEEPALRGTPEEKPMAEFGTLGETLSSLSAERRKILEKKKKKSELAPDEEERLAAPDAETNARLDEYETFAKELPEILGEGGSASVAAVRNLEPPRRAPRSMGEGSAPIRALIADDALCVFLATPDVLAVKSSKTTKDELSALIRSLRDKLADPSADPRPEAKKPHDLVIAPIRDELDDFGAETLMFSLDGPLRRVPMGALRDGEKWLVETRAVSVFAEAGRYKLAVTPVWNAGAAAPGLTGEVDGFPAPASVRGELSAIIDEGGDDGDGRGVLEGEIFPDGDFNAAALSGVLASETPVVRMASHFNFDAFDRGESFPVMGDGSRLSLREIEYDSAGLPFDYPDLLTLSARETAFGVTDAATGREVESFGAVVPRKGAMAVMASLRKVDDASTGFLMADFYRERYENGLGKAKAPRLARLRVMNGGPDGAPGDSARGRGTAVTSKDANPRAVSERREGTGRSHPFYRAPFTITGNRK
ncbi:MAG: CHAT domain-containing protein [Deltaproteobacteria bacterium]|nr:CHAT domain-containing protein [Deltaproteobacteria bacterium]